MPLPSLIDSLNKSMNNISAILNDDRNSLTVQKTSPLKSGSDNVIFQMVEDRLSSNL